jgi:flagellar basal-body rod modification protein FlgD
MSTTVGNSTSAATALAALAPPASTSAGASGSDSLQNTFLTLLVTQLQNQDPLNPTDNAQITSQMAQISTVDGINQLNASLQAMATSFSASQSLQATSLIGQTVLVPGSSLQLKSGTAVGGVNLPQAADSVVVSVLDSSGQTVDTVDLGAQAAGVLGFQWDGSTNSGTTATDGNYTFSVKASQGGKAIDAAALAAGVVGGVTPGAAGAAPMLQVNGVGQVALSAVAQIM